MDKKANIGRITYEDKRDYQIQGEDETLKITAENMNEIKRVFNGSAESIEKALDDMDIAFQNLGDYKVENGIIYFKKSDGTWNDEGVALAGQTTIKKDDVVLEEVDLSTQRTSNPTYNIVQFKDINGNVFSVEVSRDSVYVKGKDGREITQSQFDKLISNVIGLMPFYIASPTSDLDELKNFI